MGTPPLYLPVRRRPHEPITPVRITQLTGKPDAGVVRESERIKAIEGGLVIDHIGIGHDVQEIWQMISKVRGCGLRGWVALEFSLAGHLC